MLPDEMLIVRNVPVGKDIRLLPLSDVHVGSREFDEGMFLKWKENVKPDDLIVLVGDLMDNQLKSSPGSVFESTMSPMAQRKYLFDHLKDFAENNQILCSVGGNHDSARNRREVDDDPNYSLMCLLGCESVYRSRGCFVKLRFNEDGKKREAQFSKYRPTYNIAVLHGSSNGMYVSTSGAKAERYAMGISNCDLLISGHTHKPLSFGSAKLFFPENSAKTMQKKQTTIVICSSFLNKVGGYAMEKMLPVTPSAMQEIHLSAYGKGIKVISSMGGE